MASTRRNRIAIVFVGLLIALPWARTAQAARLLGVTPEGEVATVRQVLLRFSEPMIPLGDARAAAPATLSCTGAAGRAPSGRWQDDRTYGFDFEAALPAGVRCTVSVSAQSRDLAGKPIEGRREASFTTGGPSVQRSSPYAGSIVEEQQHFQLRLNGPVDFDSIERSGYCVAKGIGERIALRIVQRDPLVAGSPALGRGETPAPPGHSVTVRCLRPLPPDTALTIVWGKGIATAAVAAGAAAGEAPVARSTDQRLQFQVRQAFVASFTCERPQPNQPCSPLAPMRVEFSGPIARALAERITMRSAAATRKPQWAKDDAGDPVTGVEFAAPHPPDTAFTIDLPAGIVDDSGRPLSNAALFPLAVRSGELPPLVKFAAAPFGIIELSEDAALPVTVRNVEADLNVKALVGSQRATASSVRVHDEGQAIEWLRRLNRFHEREIQTGVDAKRQPVMSATRTLSLFESMSRARGAEGERDRQLLAAAPVNRVPLPRSESAQRPFEVIGLPLQQPGLHVVEVESLLLGQKLLESNAPMYVRTGALVTNLAVHVKLGRENSLVWVTSLDRGEVVADAQVRVLGCGGNVAWEGRTDRNGIARIDVALPSAPSCEDWDGGWFVSARKSDQRGREDFSFALTSWTRGIESWRFELPTSDERGASLRAHTVFDRTLLRAGETVSMKHFLRQETMTGLAPVPPQRLSAKLRIVHVGSDQEFTQDLKWVDGRFAASTFRIPKDAKLGVYRVELVAGDAANSGQAAQDSPMANIESGQFRVEEFRLPLIEGRIVAPAEPAVAITQLPVDLQLKYLSGGPAANLPVQVSALQRRRNVEFADFENYNFNLRERAAAQGGGEPDADPDAEAGSDSSGQGRLVADKLAVKLDAQGTGRALISDLKASPQPREILVEARFADPNGETQTIAQTVPVFPAQVLVGIKAERWISVSDKLPIRTVVLTPAGKAQADAPVEVRALRIKRTSSRKRMVGGLYSYDTQVEREEMGVVCSGRSDARGAFECQATLRGTGEVVLMASAKDGAARIAQADASVWVSGDGDTWFDADNKDRIDLLPEKKRYEPGETARLQVRMPFRHATALVAIEREGIIDTRVVRLSGKSPSIEVPIGERYGPNVYVSVLALRGRLREVPWYSMFTWGWRAPAQWWRDRQSAQDYSAPTAMIDLAKPAYKLGIAELRVGVAAHELKVSVSTDKPRYLIREQALATVKVRGHEGRTLPAGTQVAIAVVDQALLELQPNRSWNLLEAMLARRSYGIENATAQMQVVGRRHFGRKAVAPGGGGGRAPTRELFDTLLLWQQQVTLDEQGQAQVRIPINDSLTTFRVVAIADATDQRFGSGSASFTVSQDLQIASGLPPLVREGDRFSAMLTLRNSTAAAMKLRFAATGSAAGTAVATHRAELALAPGEASEVAFAVQVPEHLVRGDSGVATIDWQIEAADTLSRAADRLQLQQQVAQAVPETVTQGTMTQIAPLGAGDAERYTIVARLPADALPGRGGVRVQMQQRLSQGLPGVRRYFEQYPFVCLEQKTSKSIGLRDPALWRGVIEQMPGYLDADGLADYYPLGQDARAAGSDVLTSYLLSVTDEAARLDPQFGLPAELRERMERGLIAFVEGRIRREQWSPVRDLTARRLAALEALSRRGKVTAALLEPLAIDPNQLPTHALLDWYAVLLRGTALPQRDARLAQAGQVLRSRLNLQGTRLAWDNESGDFWWWMMANSDANSARLLSLAIDAEGWREDVPRLALGLLGRLDGGRWLTTNANLLGALAIERFSDRFERDPVAGFTAAVLRDARGGEQVRAFDWSRAPGIAAASGTAGTAGGAGGAASSVGAMQMDWPAQRAPAALAIVHDGGGRPWATIQTLAAIELKAPQQSGFRIERTVTPVTARVAGQYSRGDVLRVRLRITPAAPANWVVINDPIPAGATILGSGLGRDSQIDAQRADAGAAGAEGTRADATRAEPPVARGGARLAYEERAFDGYRAYYRFVSGQPFQVDYTMRLNNPGAFRLPPSRIEAMYNPQMFGMTPIAAIQVAQ